MGEQERFRWSLWPIVVGWFLAAYVGWHGIHDFLLLANSIYPPRGFVFSFVSPWPQIVQRIMALAQMGGALLALPSLVGFLTRKTLLTIGESGMTFDRWRGWRRIEWANIIKLEFFLGDAVFHLRENGGLTTLRFRPWTIGLDSGEFQALIERHQPRLTPDEDEGQPWGRSSSFNP